MRNAIRNRENRASHFKTFLGYAYLDGRKYTIKFDAPSKFHFKKRLRREVRSRYREDEGTDGELADIRERAEVEITKIIEDPDTKEIGNPLIDNR